MYLKKELLLYNGAGKISNSILLPLTSYKNVSAFFISEAPIMALTDTKLSNLSKAIKAAKQ